MNILPSAGRRCAPWIACAILLPSLSVAAEIPESETLDQRIDRYIVGIQNQIKNSKAKLNHGIVGIADPERTGERPTPARLCCSTNLERIRARAQDLSSAFDELGRCFDGIGESGSRVAVEDVEFDLETLMMAVERFEIASPEAETMGALGLVVRAFNAFREARVALPACEPATDAGRKKGKKGKKRKKKRKDG